MRVFFFLISAIIGSGAFILPFTLSQFASLSLYSFGFTSGIILGLTYLFSKASSVIIQEAFGSFIAKICTYFYWLIGSISTIIVINEIIIYLNLQAYSQLFSIIIISFFTLINCFSNKYSTIIEGVFTVIKISLLILIPIMILRAPATSISWNTSFNFVNLFKGISLSMWSFVGVETIPAIALEKKNLTFTSIFTMSIICCLYLLNLYTIFSRLGFNLSARPYFDVANLIGGANILSIIIAIICIGTVNSWINSSGFFAYESAKANLMPKIFLKTYNDVPYLSIILSSLILLPFVFLLKNNLAHMMIKFIDISCNGLFIFYSVFSLSYAKIHKSIFALFIGLLCIIVAIFNIISLI